MLTCTGNGLSVSLILDISSSKDTLNTGVASSGLSENVAVLIKLDLALDQGSGGVVTDGVEQTVGLNDLLLAGSDILDLQVGHQTTGLVLTLDLGCDSVEADSDLGVRQQALGHGLAST